MSEFNREDAIRVITSRDVVTSSDLNQKISTKVLSVNDFIDGDEQYRIVNLALTNHHYLGQSKAYLAEGDLSKATNQHYSQRLRANASWIPVAGEIVNVVIKETTTNNGVTGFFITAMSPLATASCSKVSADFFAVDAESEEAEEVLGKKK